MLDRVSAFLAPVQRWASRLWGILARLWAKPKIQLAVHVASALTVLVVFGAYLYRWLDFNQAMLTNPDLQTDDARTVLFPFHQYTDEGTLGDDPIAREMLSVVPWGVRLLYRIVVPFTGIFVASKVMQALAFGLVLFAAGILARARRGGLGAGLLLAFFVLHDWFAVDRIAGGLPRAFGFPCFALWLAGVIAAKPWARWSAPVIAALSYPSVMNMLLAAEGLYALRGLAMGRWRVTWHRLRRYAMVVGLCFLAVFPAVVGGDDRGPIHSLEQAEKEPAFARKGRLWVLPFPEPTTEFGKALVDQLRVRGASPWQGLARPYQQHETAWAMGILATLLVLPLLGLGRRATLPLVFFTGTVILYLLARVLAFQLYSPERYYSFGARMVTIAILVAIPAQMWSWLRPRPRAIVRNFLAAGFVLLIWGATGDGQHRPSGMYLNAAKDRELYEFIRTLPKDARFAAHPLDGDGIPFFSARATTGSYETLQPWFVDSWQRQKELARATLRALYATNAKEVLDYAERRGVTHFLINRYRYGRKYKQHAGSFQPLSDYARGLLNGVQSKELVLRKPPKEALLYSTERWYVVDVAKLKRAWK